MTLHTKYYSCFKVWSQGKFILTFVKIIAFGAMTFHYGFIVECETYRHNHVK
jgi:hypothetical protein